MPPKMTPASAQIEPGKFWTISRAARKLGIPDSTLSAAIFRGDTALVTCALGCGITLVELASARRWSRQKRKRGRGSENYTPPPKEPAKR